MFTSIEKLRASSAIQSRVTQVETYLKRTYGKGKWNPLSPFPAAVILISNTFADYEWVINQPNLAAPAYGGVDPASYAKPGSFTNKAEARVFVSDLIDAAFEIDEPLLEFVDDAFESVATTTGRVSAKSQNKASTPRQAKAVVKAETLDLIEASQTPGDAIGVTVRSIRTRKGLEDALQGFIVSKMVTTLAPISSAEAKAAGIDVPKGKQARVIVF